jgi:hypothetical protein
MERRGERRVWQMKSSNVINVSNLASLLSTE